MRKYRKCNVPGCNNIALEKKEKCKQHSPKKSSIKITIEKPVGDNYKIETK